MDKTITYAEFCKMLTNYVTLYDKELVSKWKKVAALALKSNPHQEIGIYYRDTEFFTLPIADLHQFDAGHILYLFMYENTFLSRSIRSKRYQVIDAFYIKHITLSLRWLQDRIYHYQSSNEEHHPGILKWF